MFMQVIVLHAKHVVWYGKWTTEWCLLHCIVLKLHPLPLPPTPFSIKAAASTILFSPLVCDRRSPLPSMLSVRDGYSKQAMLVPETTAISAYVMAAGWRFISWLVEAVTNHLSWVCLWGRTVKLFLDNCGLTETGANGLNRHFTPPHKNTK